MRRTRVYFDGFNMFHALDEVGQDHLKWLCLRRLSESFIGKDEVLNGVKYFSAYATWDSAGLAIHQDYVAALTAEGVTPILGNFKKKHLRCRICSGQYHTHEEKETDVNIAIHLISDLFQDEFDRAIIVSADTDLCSTVNMARSLRPGKQINVISPPGRRNRSRSLSPLFEITKGRLAKCRLDESYTLPDGREINSPAKYKLPKY